jgi:hypothetical protein
MPTRENLNCNEYVQVLDPAVLTADTVLTGADTSDCNAVTLNVLVGESGDTLSGSVYWDFILETSEDNSTWAAVTDNALVVGQTVDSSGIFATIDAPAEDDVILSVGYIGYARYVRVNIDATGTHTNGTPMGAVAVKGNLKLAPAIA